MMIMIACAQVNTVYVPSWKYNIMKILLFLCEWLKGHFVIPIISIFFGIFMILVARKAAKIKRFSIMTFVIGIPVSYFLAIYAFAGIYTYMIFH